MFVKNATCTDYTDTVKYIYHLLRDTYGYNLRIVNVWEYLKLCLNVDEFEILNLRLSNLASFESYMVDRQIDWMNGKDVDFSEIYDAIVTVGDFTTSEKRLMKDRQINEILWGMFLAICSPELTI